MVAGLPSNGIPLQFSTADGSLTGAVDGSNPIFTFPYPLTTAIVWRNGVLMTQPSDVAFTSTGITFQAGQIPQIISSIPDIVTIEGYV